MYEQHFGLTERPFSLLPDPGFLYLSSCHRGALGMLEYGLVGDAGFVVITGEVGAGKTTLIRKFLKLVDDQTTVAVLSSTNASRAGLLEWVAAAFGLEHRGKDPIELMDVFIRFLREQRAAGRKTMLILDEAQNLDIAQLEELRMLSNVNVDSTLLVQIVLVGQPELLQKLRQPELRQLAQRIGVDYHLVPLTAEETYTYIRHRLRTAGGDPDIFEPKASAAVYLFTGGVPRLINTLCDTALVYGFGAGGAKIDLATIVQVVRDRKRTGIVPFKLEPDALDLAEVERLAGLFEPLDKNATVVPLLAATDREPSVPRSETMPTAPRNPARASLAEALHSDLHYGEHGGRSATMRSGRTRRWWQAWA